LIAITNKHSPTTPFSNNGKKLKTSKPSGLVPNWNETPSAPKPSTKAAGKTPAKAPKKAPVRAPAKASKAVRKCSSKETVASDSESLAEFGGLPDEVDQTRNREVAHSQINAVQSRRTAQVSMPQGFHCFDMFYCTYVFILFTAIR
jgi:hypothetical protein